MSPTITQRTLRSNHSQLPTRQFLSHSHSHLLSLSHSHSHFSTFSLQTHHHQAIHPNDGDQTSDHQTEPDDDDHEFLGYKSKTTLKKRTRKSKTNPTTNKTRTRRVSKPKTSFPTTTPSQPNPIDGSKTDQSIIAQDNDLFS